MNELLAVALAADINPFLTKKCDLSSKVIEFLLFAHCAIEFDLVQTTKLVVVNSWSK